MINIRRNELSNAIYVLPAFLFVVLFFLIPLGMCFHMSFFNWPLFGEIRFLGIKNYITLLSDVQAAGSFVFTLLYTIIVTPVIFVCAFVLAMMVNRRNMLFIGFFRTVYFLPVVIGLSTSSLLWLWLLNDQVGVVNDVLMKIGLINEPILWLGEVKLALLSVIISVVWKTVGFSMILLLGGLQSIPEELYESARIDGCSGFASLIKITIPLMRRSFSMTLLLSIIGSLLAFDQFYIMTSGKPANSTITSVYWIFVNSFQKFKLGYGSAMSLVYLFILLGFCMVQLKISDMKEE